MRFYTNVCRIGNNLCVREQTESGPSKFKIRYEPKLYIKSDKESEFKTLYGDYASEIVLDTMSDSKEFVKKYKDIRGFEIYGQTDHVLAYINETYPANMKFDSKLISAWSIDIETRLPVSSKYNDSHVVQLQVGPDLYQDIKLSDIRRKSSINDGEVFVIDETTGQLSKYEHSCYYPAISGFPDVDTANVEITLITIQSLNTKHCFTFAAKAYDGPPIQAMSYMNCGSEKNMLREFINFWVNKNVEVITGWNIEKFDIPFIARRVYDVCGEDWMKKLSPWGVVEFKKVRTAGFGGEEHTVVNIAGVSILDYMLLYKKFVFVKHESYSLGHIAQEELGTTKLDHSQFKNFNEFQDKGWSLFVRYNIIDTSLVSQLEDKLKLIELAYTLSYLARINYANVYGPVKMWDAIIHNELKQDKIVIPLKQADTGSGESIEGAYVKDPAPGFKDWVVSLDATSLYPSIMMTLNLSPETYLGQSDMNLESLLSGAQQMVVPDGEAWAPSGARYSTKKRGIIPDLIEQYMAKRKSAKKAMLTKEQELENIKIELSKRNLKA